MDLVKIGHFIAQQRKNQNLTQQQLADQLSITDRAVSKWERGLSLPDASIMLDLCSILEINVNELLSGEKIRMEDLEKKNQELLVEMTRQEEVRNKKMMTSMYVLMTVVLLLYFGIVFLTCFLIKDEIVVNITMIISTLILVLAAFWGVKLEVDIGYYQCAKCEYKFIPTYKDAVLAAHIGSTRYLKCPHCQKRSWAKKAMSK